MEDFYETKVEDAARFAGLAQQAVADGFTAMKCMLVPPTMPLEGLRPVKAAERCATAIRAAVGDEIDLMVDCHARPSPAMGLQFAKALEPIGLYFFEEPCWPEAIEGLAEIKRAVKTPIATGERITSLAGFRDLFAARACDVCQLDITHCGGLSEARRIAALAEAHRIALAPHNPQGPVSTAASLEFGFPSQVTSSAKRCMRMSRGGKMSYKRDSRWKSRAASSGPTRVPAWALPSTRRRFASIPFSKRSRSACFIGMAASGIGNRS
jgi:galactonate dehydratase